MINDFICTVIISILIFVGLVLIFGTVSSEPDQILFFCESKQGLIFSRKEFMGIHDEKFTFMTFDEVDKYCLTETE